jgi:hypothetical protein
MAGQGARLETLIEITERGLRTLLELAVYICFPDLIGQTRSQSLIVEQTVAHADIDGMREKGLSALPHQRKALDKAGTALDTIRPHARADLASAFERQPELVRLAAQGNSQSAISAMRQEAEIRTDPNKRADRFTEGWQRLHQQRAALTRSGQHDAARKIGGQMGAMAKSLERDAQVESILSTRKAALGIDMRSVRPIGQELAEIAAIGRVRSLGIGIGM